jgi:predicted RNA binding protein YcfA (HicA-like mRNA interferase family)
MTRTRSLGPTSRRRLISTLKDLGFTGPCSGGRHEFLVRNDVVVTVPNPHRGDIGVGLLAVILKQAGVTKSEWEHA